MMSWSEDSVSKTGWAEMCDERWCAHLVTPDVPVFSQPRLLSLNNPDRLLCRQLNIKPGRFVMLCILFLINLQYRHTHLTTILPVAACFQLLIGMLLIGICIWGNRLYPHNWSLDGIVEACLVHQAIYKVGWMRALHSSMCSWATFTFIPPPHLSCFYLSLLNPSVPILSVCVFVWMMTQSEAFDTVQKKDDENQGEMPQHSLKSDLRWQTLRPQRMMPHMLTVLPCCCVEALGNDTLQGRKMCFALNMQPFSYKMFSLTSRRPCCLSLKDFWS